MEDKLKFKGNISSIAIRPSGIKVEFNLPAIYLEAHTAMQIIRDAEAKVFFKTENEEASWLCKLDGTKTAKPEGWKVALLSGIEQVEWFAPVINMLEKEVEVEIELLARS